MTYSRGCIHYHRPKGLDFRVRKGNGYGPLGIVTRNFCARHSYPLHTAKGVCEALCASIEFKIGWFGDGALADARLLT